MPEETLVEAASSAVAVEPSLSLEIPRSNTPEYQQWRETGSLPDNTQPKKTEEAAPSSDAKPEGEAKPVGEPEAPEKQQEQKPKVEPRPKQTAEERIAQLEATIEKIRKGKVIETPKVESTPKPQPAQQQFARPKPTAEDKNPDGTPKFATYEDFVEDLSDWKTEQRLAARDREMQEQAQTKQFNAKVEEAEARYENFKEVVGPTATALNEDPAIIPVVKQMLLDSEVLPDLLFTLGSDPAEFAKFVKMAKGDPGKAIRYIALTENLIAEELAKGKQPEATRNEQGRFAKAEIAAPAKRGPESAPAPPLEIGSRGTGPMDESERALQSIERGDGNAFRTWMDAENRKDLKRRSGA